MAMEARSELKKGIPSSSSISQNLTSVSSLSTKDSRSYTDIEETVELVWPVICFVVLGSTLVHGLSTAGISVGSHLSRKRGERAPLLGQETDGLEAMVHDESVESEPEVSGSETD